MSDPNYNRDQLLNTTYNKTRELEARIADIEARLERRGVAPTPKEQNDTGN